MLISLVVAFTAGVTRNFVSPMSDFFCRTLTVQFPLASGCWRFDFAKLIEVIVMSSMVSSAASCTFSLGSIHRIDRWTVEFSTCVVPESLMIRIGSDVTLKILAKFLEINSFWSKSVLTSSCMIFFASLCDFETCAW